jgi:hypothetical protein
MYPLLMAQIAHAKSMGLESSLPEHYGQNVPNGH